MEIVHAEVLDKCERKHADIREPLRAWRDDVRRASWKTWLDIKEHHVKASIIGGKCVVFDIKGNRYRLVVRINYRFGFVYVLFAGTHEEYNKIDVAEICGES